MSARLLLGSPMLWPVAALVVALIVAAAFFHIKGSRRGLMTSFVLVVVSFFVLLVSLVGHISVYDRLGPVEIKEFGLGTVTVEAQGCTARYPVKFLAIADGNDPLQYPRGKWVSGSCGTQDAMDLLFFREINGQ